MQEVDALIRSGDIIQLKQKQGTGILHRNIHGGFISAAACGKVEILEYLASLIHGYRKHSIIKSTFEVAIMYKQFEAVSWYLKCIPACTLLSDDTCRIGDEKTLYMLIDKGWIPNMETCKKAAAKGNVEMVRWLFRYGLILDEAIKPSVREDEMLAIYHEYGIEGYYTKECTSECRWCKREQVKDMWIMMNEEYTDVVQWLPREILDDVTAML